MKGEPAAALRGFDEADRSYVLRDRRFGHEALGDQAGVLEDLDPQPNPRGIREEDDQEVDERTSIAQREPPWILRQRGVRARSWPAPSEQLSSLVCKHSASMGRVPTLYIRNTPAALVDALRRRARLNGRSLNAEAIEVLEHGLADRRFTDEWWDEFDAFTREFAAEIGAATPSPEILIRADRDAR